MLCLAASLQNLSYPALDKVPFSVYDFFAYLSSGSILLATFDLHFWVSAPPRKRKIAPLFAVLRR